MLTEKEILINKAAQNLLARDQLFAWFESCSANEQAEILSALSYICGQAHPLPEETKIAIRESGLKSTYTPCVLLEKYPVADAIGKIRQLPPNENAKSFRLIFELFKIADTRRRETKCNGICNHEWHHI